MLSTATISRRQGYVGQDFDELSRIAGRSTLSYNIYEVSRCNLQDDEGRPVFAEVYDVASEDKELLHVILSPLIIITRVASLFGRVLIENYNRRYIWSPGCEL